MKAIFELAKQLQSKRDALDDKRDAEIKALEPLKRYSLRRNAGSIRTAARAKLRSRGIDDFGSQEEVLYLMEGIFDELPDVYEERVGEVRKQYSDSLNSLEKGYRPLFQHELDRIKASVGKIEEEKKTDAPLDATQMQKLQLLALRNDAVSKAELDGFAEMAKGNLSALTLLDQIAERSTPQDMYGRHMPSHRYRNMYSAERSKKEKAEDALKQLAQGVSNYLNNHSDRASRIQQEHYNLAHGTQVDSARWAFSDLDTFYHRIEVDSDSLEVLSALEE